MCTSILFKGSITNDQDMASEAEWSIVFGLTVAVSSLAVLPPSQNSCPTSSLNRENSGIAPKHHTIRNLLIEHYPSMNIM